MEEDVEILEKKIVRLFCDDCRIPVECAAYMKKRIGVDSSEYLREWVVVRNYEEFVDYVKDNGIPDIVSLDDLTHKHLTSSVFWEKTYDSALNTEETGSDCAKFLVEYCKKNEVKMPQCFVHSMNLVEIDHILNSLKTKI